MIRNRINGVERMGLMIVKREIMWLLKLHFERRDSTKFLQIFKTYMLQNTDH